MCRYVLKMILWLTAVLLIRLSGLTLRGLIAIYAFLGLTLAIIDVKIGVWYLIITLLIVLIYWGLDK